MSNENEHVVYGDPQIAVNLMTQVKMVGFAYEISN